MQFKKLALTLTLSAAFGLMACGDDSSSGTNGGSAKEELAALEAEFEQLQKEAMEAHEKLGECSEENKGEKKNITLLKKDYSVVCEEDDDGEWEWESDELDNLFDEYEDKIEEARKKVKEEEKKDPTDDPEFPIIGKGCNFKLEDKVWSYNVSTDLHDEGTTHVISMKFEGTTLIETSINTVSGGSISTACKYMDEDDMYDTEKIDETKTRETFVECEGDKMITTDVTTTTNAVNEEHDRNFYFEQFMSECKMINGIEDEEEEEEEEGDDSSSKDENKGTPTSSDSDSPIVGPSGDDPAASVTDCDEMIYENNVWKVTSTLAATNMTTIVVYEWEGFTVHQYMEMKTKMESQDECESVLSFMQDQVEATCEEGMLIEKMDLSTSEYASEEEKKEFFDLIMSTECSN